MIAHKLIPIIALLLALLLAPLASSQQTNTVEIRDEAYSPDNIEVPMGSTVAWINNDEEGHTVTSDDGLFQSGTIRPGGRYLYTFDKPGVFRYYCEIHPMMRGTVTVTSPQGQTGTAAIALPVVYDYTPFYVVGSGVAPERAFGAPESFDVLGTPPQNIYLGGLEDQSLPYLQYLASSAAAGPYTLWIEGGGSWIRYARVPRGSSLSLVAVTPEGGNGTLYEIYPDERTSESSYDLFQYNRIAFYADRVGRHMLFYTIGGRASNLVVIDVTDEPGGVSTP